MPYTNKVIAEIVSLSQYESQVSTLMEEDERIAMEFFIACAPEDHPLIPGAGPGRIYRASIYAKSRKKNLSAADQNTLSKLATLIKHSLKGESRQ